MEFNGKWYKIVGVAVTMTLLINAFAPIVQFFTTYSIMWLKRSNDRGFCTPKDQLTTKQTSIIDYINLYAGPEYAVDQRFSAILLQLLFSSLFGATMPMLWLIGFLSFGVSIFVEKITLCYFYREPPMYDESITRISNKLINTIAHIGLLSTFWQLGNTRIFDNDAGGELVLMSDHSKTSRSLFIAID